MINKNIQALGKSRSVIREIFEYGRKRKSEIGEENVFDFSLGNPSVEPPEALTERLFELIKDESAVSLHSYTSSDGELSVRRAIAEELSKRYNEEILPECLFMTMGAAMALTTVITAVVCPNEEVICLTPYFPEYRVFIERVGGVVREVKTKEESFGLDLFDISQNINEKTAAIIINSPNNPTGAVYTEEELSSLGKALREAEKKYGRTIYLISDEPYRELVYTEGGAPFVLKYYADTVICYSYSKSLSLPGERIGYALISPKIADFESVKEAVMGAARSLGHVCAPSLLQKLIGKVTDLSPRISEYRENGELLYRSLTELGYTARRPDGAFYLFVRALESDAVSFCEVARRFELLLVPSDSFGITGYVRLAYCVSRAQIEKSIPAFKKLIEYYKRQEK